MLYDRFREACEKRGTTITQVPRTFRNVVEMLHLSVYHIYRK